MTAGYAGKRFILERAHALGVVVVVVDSPESWSHGLVAEGIVDHFIADVAPHEEQDHDRRGAGPRPPPSAAEVEG